MGIYIGHRLVARPELDNTFWTDRTMNYCLELTVEVVAVPCRHLWTFLAIEVGVVFPQLRIPSGPVFFLKTTPINFFCDRLCIPVSALNTVQRKIFTPFFRWVSNQGWGHRSRYDQFFIPVSGPWSSKPSLVVRPTILGSPCNFST